MDLKKKLIKHENELLNEQQRQTNMLVDKHPSSSTLRDQYLLSSFINYGRILRSMVRWYFSIQTFQFNNHFISRKIVFLVCVNTFYKTTKKNKSKIFKIFKC